MQAPLPFGLGYYEQWGWPCCNNEVYHTGLAVLMAVVMAVVVKRRRA